MSDHALERVRAATARRSAARRGRRAAWRQYRLERRMFWRNPTAAFFGFLLPLLLLAMFGAIFSGEQDELDVVVPGIAGMSVMAATFVALAYNLTFLRERGILKRLRGTPLPLVGLPGGHRRPTRSPTRCCRSAVVIVAGRRRSSASRGRATGSRCSCSWPPASICFASLGVALSHAIPNSESAPAYVNAVFLPMIMIAGVFYDDEDAPAVLRDLAEALPLKHLIDGLSGAMVNGEGIADHAVALVALACGRPPGSCSPCAASRGKRGGAEPRRYLRPTSSTQIAPSAPHGASAPSAEAAGARSVPESRIACAAGCSATRGASPAASPRSRSRTRCSRPTPSRASRRGRDAPRSGPPARWCAK